MPRCRSLALLLTAGLVGAPQAFSQPPAPPAPGDDAVVVIDAAGKEHRLGKWKITQGTRHLTWLAEGPSDKKAPSAPPRTARPGRSPELPRPPIGPLAFELREEKSTTYVKGILTLIPLECIRQLSFDAEKQTIAVHLAGEGQDTVLTGSTRFRGINKITLQGEEVTGMKPVPVSFMGGVPQGIVSVRFPGARAASAPTGRAARVTINEEAKTVVEVKDLRPLYQLPSGAEQLTRELWFRKTLHLDMKDIHKLVNTSDDALESVCRVVLADGTDETLTVLSPAPVAGKEATLIGLLGKVPAGYRLFPMHTFLEIELEKGE